MLKSIKTFEHIENQYLQVSELSDSDLLKLSKWATDLDAKLGTVRRAIREAKTLLTPANFSKMDVLIHGRDEKRLFSKFIAKLAKRQDDHTSLAA